MALRQSPCRKERCQIPLALMPHRRSSEWNVMSWRKFEHAACTSVSMFRPYFQNTSPAAATLSLPCSTLVVKAKCAGVKVACSLYGEEAMETCVVRSIYHHHEQSRMWLCSLADCAGTFLEALLRMNQSSKQVKIGVP